MFKDDIKTNIDSVKSLITISKILGILPLNLRNIEQCKCRYLYPLLTIVVFMIIFSFSAHGKLKLGEYLVPTVHIMNIACDLALIITNLVSIIGINLMKGAQVCTFLNNIRALDHDFYCIKQDIRYPSLQFVIEIVLYHILFFIYYTYNVYIWSTSLGLEIFKYFIVRDFQYYHIIILSLLIRYYALSIKFRFEILNRILVKVNKGHDEGIRSLIDVDGNTVHNLETIEALWNMKKIMNIYTKLSSIVDQYNDIFGWQFITLYIVIVLNLLMPINLALVYGDGMNKLYGTTFGMDFVVLCILCCCIPLSIIRAIFTAAEQGAAEASNTATICYTMVHELSNNEKDILLKEDILELAHQATSKCPQFSAAGFFTVNYTILFSLVGSISSYLIVLIQFNK